MTRRLGLLILVLVAVILAGCLGGNDAQQADPSSTDRTTGLNPWQTGLDDDYPTPDVAKNRSAEERRADVAEPGSPEFAAFDATMEAWMEKHNVTAGQLALMKDGQLRYERGYGYTDRAETEPTKATTMFRIASVTKPMTAALVALQVEQGLYNWSDPVFCLGEDPAPSCRLPIDPHPDFPMEDARLADMEVEHLVAHECGWADQHNDHTFGDGAIEAAREMGLPSPLSAWRTAQFLMGEPLAYDPGEETRYSNPCYILAGLVAEAATGAELGALYDAYLFGPLGIEDDIEPGRTRLEDRNPREPFYHCAEKARSVFDPNETVCEPNGEHSLQTILANGGLVATSEAVAAVYEAYPEHVPSFELGVEADPTSPSVQATNLHCPPSTTCRFHSGEFPGTATSSGMVVGDTWTGQFVILFNKAVPWEGCRSSIGDLLQGSPQPYHECEVHDLESSMFHFTGAWAGAEETTS